MSENSNIPDAQLLKKLNSELATLAESRKEAETKPVSMNSTGMALGMRMGAEFVSAIIVGALLGYGFDYWFKPEIPYGLLVGLVIGFAAGTTNLIRASREYSSSLPPIEAVAYEENEEEE